jgi:hypothetical protein
MKALLFIVALSLTFISCSDDPTDDPAKREALTTGTWKLTAKRTDYQKDGTYEEDTYAMFDGCLKDNIYTFQVDGTLVTDEGPVKCYDTNPQTQESTWTFSDNQRKLKLGTLECQIEELTQTTLTLKYNTSYNVIYTINVKNTYTKQ